MACHWSHSSLRTRSGEEGVSEIEPKKWGSERTEKKGVRGRREGRGIRKGGMDRGKDGGRNGGRGS